MRKFTILSVVALFILWPLIPRMNQSPLSDIEQRRQDNAYVEQFVEMKALEDPDDIFGIQEIVNEYVEVIFLTSLNGEKFKIDFEYRDDLAKGTNRYMLSPGPHMIEYEMDGRWKEERVIVPDQKQIVYYLNFSASPDEHSLSIADEFNDLYLGLMNIKASEVFEDNIRFVLKAESTIYHFDEHLTRLKFQSGMLMDINGDEFLRKTTPDIYFHLNVDDEHQVVYENGKRVSPMLAFNEMMRVFSELRKGETGEIIDLANLK